MKSTCRHLQDILIQEEINCLELHGDKGQSTRDKSLSDFKYGRCNILIATDLASRGLDIKNINFVINFDMPLNVEDYIHRIGRTGRAGNKGSSISFFTKDDVPLSKELINVLHLSKQEIPEELRNITRLQTPNNYNRNQQTKGGYSRNQPKGYSRNQSSFENRVLGLGSNRNRDDFGLGSNRNRDDFEMDNDNENDFEFGMKRRYKRDEDSKH